MSLFPKVIADETGAIREFPPQISVRSRASRDASQRQTVNIGWVIGITNERRGKNEG